MSAQALLDEDPQPDDVKIRESLSGNLCRCGGYNRIVAAVRAASKAGRNGEDSRATKSAGSATEWGQHQPDHATRRDGKNVEAWVGANVRRFGGRERVSGNQRFLRISLLRACFTSNLSPLTRPEHASFPWTRPRLAPCPLSSMSLRPTIYQRRFRASGRFTRTGRSLRSVRRNTTESPWRPWRQSRKRPPNGRSLWCASNTRRCRRFFSVAAALAPGAPLVQDPALRAGDPLAATNILKERRYGWGKVDSVAADFVVENSYSFPMVTHFAIEPHGFMALVKRCPENMESSRRARPPGASNIRFCCSGSWRSCSTCR
jgi:[2Fe-2S] binding domain